MTPELEREDRAESVRKAAAAWRRAGLVGDAVVAAVKARHPDDRSRVGPAFRVLLFLFTLVAVGGAFGFFLALTGIDYGQDVAMSAVCLLGGVAMIAATEVQIGRLRRRQGGTEAATSWLAISFLLAAAMVGFDSIDNGWAPLSLLAAALLALAAWRWGYPLYAGAAAVALLVASARLPTARLLWIVVPLIAAPVLLRLGRSPRLPPAHRASVTLAASVALAGLYAAVHLGSWEAHLIENLGGRQPDAGWVDSELLWWGSVAATALVPVLLLAAGIRGRRYPLLLLGLGTAVASLVTLRYYVHLAPLWVVLTVSGALLLGAVLLLRRWLAAGPDGERHGFTAAPLFTDLDRQRILEAAAAAAVFAPDARSISSGPSEPAFKGGGGEFGGGGASGSF